MTLPVLLGGRHGIRAKTRTGWIVSVWLPVLICLLVIARESTDSFASEYTAGPLRRAFMYVFGYVSPERWVVVHHYMRKTGHFMGYGFTGLAWLRAWLLIWLIPLRRQGAWLWRCVGLLLGLFCTTLTACVDELHQTYIPSRTGLMSDVCLDTAGAAALMTLLAIVWITISRKSDRAVNTLQDH